MDWVKEISGGSHPHPPVSVTLQRIDSLVPARLKIAGGRFLVVIRW